MANIGDVTARLRADVSDYVTGMQKAQTANQGLTDAVTRSNSQFVATQAQLQQTTAWYDRTMASTAGLRQGIDVLKADVAQATADFKAGLISVQDYRTALDQARQSALGIRGAGGLNGAEMSALNAILVKTAPAAEGAIGGLNRVAMAAAMMASQASGAGFIVGRLAGALGLTVASAPVVIGVLAGVGSMIAIWSQYQGVITKVDAQNKQAADGLAKLAEQGMNPVIKQATQAGQAVDAFAAATDRATLKARILGTLGGVATMLGLGGAASSITGIPISTADENTAALAGFEGQRKVFTDGLGTTEAVMKTLTEAETKAANAVKFFGDEAEVAALRARGVSPEIIRQAEAHQENARQLAVERTGMEIAAEVTGMLADKTNDLNKELRAIPPTMVDLTEQTFSWRQSLEAVRSPLDDALDRAKALQDLQALQARQQFTLTPESKRELQGLGIDSGAVEASLQKVQDALANKAEEVKSRLKDLMRTTGQQGVRALVEGFADGTNAFEAFFRKTLLDFLSAGLFDAFGELFGTLFGGGGSGPIASLSGGGGGGFGNNAIRMHVNVGPSRDPMSLARDGQWQQALRESLLVAKSQGFK